MDGQSKKHSILEITTNVVLGIVIGFTLSQLAHEYEAQIRHYIWAGFTWNLSASSNMLMTLILTSFSLIRGYIVRRVFNTLHVKTLDKPEQYTYN